MEHKPTPNVADICEVVGRMEIAKAVGRGKQAVSNAVADNCFPASWFAAVRRLCNSAGIECPEHLFSFVRPTEFERATPGRHNPPDRASA